jgi:hypothetical protein
MATIEDLQAELARRRNKPATLSLADIQSEIIRRQGEGVPSDILAQAQQRDPSLIPQRQGTEAERFIDPALTLATGAIAEPVAGIIGAATAAIPGTPEGAGAGVADIVREKLTFQPKGVAGQEGLQAFSETVGGAITTTLDAVTQFGRDIGVPEVLLQPVGDVVFEATGSPAAATAAATAPAAIFEFLGLKGLQKLRPGTKLLKPDGRPTKLLENKLDKQGLVFDNLSPEAKAAIPEVAPKRIIPGGKEIVPTSEKVLVEQIKSGAKDNALAGLKVVKDRVVPDDAGIEAVRQGFDAGFVQSAKTASRETKAGMKKMLDIVQRVKSNTRLGLDIRPGNIVGDSLSKRIKFIRGKADAARKELDRMALGKPPAGGPIDLGIEGKAGAASILRGQKVDGAPVIAQLQKSLGDLDIELIDGPNGIPQPVFKGSQISKDRTSQRIIKDVIDLMAEGGRPDALRMHKLKRQLDRMIDFRKKSAGGLTDAGKGVLRDIRTSLNQAIRSVNPDYARVNDIMSSSLTALDDFQKAAGTTIDIFGPGSDAIIGQKMRTLMSNNVGRINLENSVNQLNSVAAGLGAKFGDDIKDLASFANSIEDRFGVAAQTSLKGDIEGVITRAGQQGAKATLVQAVAGKVAKGAEKLRGINDLNAFRAMADILNK